MYCVSCGSTLPAGSRFCNVCGTAQPAKAPAAAANQPQSRGDGPIFELRPTLRFIIAGYFVVALISVGCAALVGILDRPFWIVLIAAAILLAIPGWYHLRRETEVYRLTDTMIEIRRGLLGRTVRHIPLSSVQDVTTSATVGERLLGIGSIEIDSAAEAGKILIRNVPRPAKYADAILAQIRPRN
ncbi:MAG TPA: PH domain-containing protein [Blastocatellia bacterium]|nr:PH domain-containing protein [Blastocatellia bacterium]